MTIPSDWQLEIVRRDAEFVLYRGRLCLKSQFCTRFIAVFAL